jgi:hypothetical protein
MKNISEPLKEGTIKTNVKKPTYEGLQAAPPPKPPKPPYNKNN